MIISRVNDTKEHIIRLVLALPACCQLPVGRNVKHLDNGRSLSFITDLAFARTISVQMSFTGVRLLCMIYFGLYNSFKNLCHCFVCMGAKSQHRINAIHIIMCALINVCLSRQVIKGWKCGSNNVFMVEWVVYYLSCTYKFRHFTHLIYICVMLLDNPIFL